MRILFNSIFLVVLGFTIVSANAFAQEGSLSPAPLSTEERLSLFQKGISSYNESDYEAALSYFETMLHDGFINGEVFYNLGNAYYRQGHLGHALASYLKAKKLIPRNSDLIHNLAHARKQAQDRIELGQWENIKRILFFWVDLFNPLEWFWGFLIFHTLFWLVTLYRLFRRSEWINGLFGVSLSLCLLTLVVFLGRFYFAPAQGVITESEVSIYSGPGSANTELFRLHEGTELRLLDSEGPWYRLRLADGKEGWLEAGFVARADFKDQGYGLGTLFSNLQINP